MKTKLFFLAGFIALAIALGAYFFSANRESSRIAEVLEAVKTSIGTKEDPAARARYEWMRLHDPATGQIPPNIRQKELAFAATLPTKESIAASKMNKSGSSTGEQLITWSSRGPYNIGGRTRALALDVLNENIILAGGVSGGMWRSTNGGSSWTKVTAVSDLQSVTCIAQDTRGGHTLKWYYGTGEYIGGSASGGGNDAFYSGDGIYKSTDGGITWAVLPSTDTGIPQTFDNFFDYVWNVVTDPSNASQDEVYAATWGAIFRSTNGGTSWTPVLGGSPSFSAYVDVAITSTGVVYATLSGEGTNGGIWRSPDGTTWTEITNVGWPLTFNRVVIGIAPSNENIVYFIAETPGSGTNNHSLWKYKYLSGNGSGSSGSWENRSANLPAVVPPVAGFDSQNSYDLIIKVKPGDTNAVFIGGTNLYRSTNGFSTGGATTWIGGYSDANDITRYLNHHPDQHSLVFLPSSAVTMISGHDGGLSKTTNNLATPVVWTSLNTGYVTTQYYTIAIDHGTSGNNIVIGGMQDNGTWFTNSTNAGAAWVEEFSGDGAACAIANGRVNGYYVSAQFSVVYRLLLDDNGILQGFTRVDPTGGTGYLFINPFVLDPNNTNMMYLAGGDRVWRNSDLTGVPLGGNGTTSVNWTNLTNSIVSGTISALGISTTSANRLYYGTDDSSRVYRLDNANSGNPFPIDVWRGKGFPANAYVSCVAVDPSNSDKAMVVFSNYSVVSLFYTTNAGTNWTAVAGNLEQNTNGTGNGPSCRWASIVPAGGGTTHYFVTTSTGIYSTTTLNGNSTVWALEGASAVGNVVVDMLDVRLSDGRIVAGTHGNGVYSGTVTITGVDLVDGTVPSEFSLMQNYPNPFNPITKIQYAIPEESDVSLKVFSIEGKEVVTLVDARQSPGTYIAAWDGKNESGKSVASGVYFYRLQAGGLAHTKRMVLLK